MFTEISGLLSAANACIAGENAPESKISPIGIKTFFMNKIFYLDSRIFINVAKLEGIGKKGYHYLLIEW
ncbi:hypothetical protein CE91St1_15580 [Parabacteroides goldsteinii]|nr:hypothetical protein CE91St1_15580 [Parabacteroides goldsteinii]GKG78487.1 hypothetical protein CE91St2_16790 [Parabacteroides goldsteinii]